MIRIPEEIEGDTVSLAVQGDERTLLSTTAPAGTTCPTLEGFALRAPREFVLHAERLDGDLWAVSVNAL